MVARERRGQETRAERGERRGRETVGDLRSGERRGRETLGDLRSGERRGRETRAERAKHRRQVFLRSIKERHVRVKHRAIRQNRLPERMRRAMDDAPLALRLRKSV